MTKARQFEITLDIGHGYKPGSVQDEKAFVDDVLKKKPGKVLEVDANQHLVEVKDELGQTKKQFRRLIFLGGTTYFLEAAIDASGEGQDAADQLWKAAKSFRQSDAQSKAFVARDEALKKLKAAGAEVSRPVTGRLTIRVTEKSATDDTLNQLKAIPDLQALELHDLSGAAPTTVQKVLRELVTVRTLELRGDWATDVVMSSIPKDVEILSLNYTKLTDKGFADCGRFMTLRSVTLTEGEITDGVLPMLDQVKTLESATFVRTKITEPAIKKWKEQRPKVEVNFEK